MKIVAVMVHIEVPCPRCGAPMIRMGKASFLPDGRIGEPEYVASEDAPCNDCHARDRREEERQQKAERIRLKFAKGAVPNA